MKEKDLIYKGAQGKLSGYDLSIPDHFNGTLIFFVHGYKGYKNWGTWDLISDYFYNNGFGFAKCNLSHNGTTLDVPNDFTDLDSFAQNRYTYELFDIKSFMHTVQENLSVTVKHNVLIGHSRGGGDVILSASTLPNIDVLITWAAISDIGNRFPKGENLKKWEETGVFTVLNGRTKQNMPHYFSFYKDYLNHKSELDIQKVAGDITIPWAIIHGTSDAAVHISEGKALKKASKNAELFEIEHANHVFGGKEPYTSTVLPEHSKILVETTLEFIKKHVSCYYN